MEFGERGRELGAASLKAIATDETLSVSVRANAARALSKARPDLRNELLRLLWRLSTTENPLARISVLTAVGQGDAAAGAFALRDMASDRTLKPGVRLRAAAALTGLRRDYRETAAAVAREVAHDKRVRHHIRVKAARALARWSKLCRAEAQALLVEFGAKQQAPA
jgi:cellulose synthase operon protein C